MYGIPFFIQLKSFEGHLYSSRINLQSSPIPREANRPFQVPDTQEIAIKISRIENSFISVSFGWRWSQEELYSYFSQSTNE